jgi:CheY-like chemotaxis protein
LLKAFENTLKYFEIRGNFFLNLSGKPDNWCRNEKSVQARFWIPVFQSGRSPQVHISISFTGRSGARDHRIEQLRERGQMMKKILIVDDEENLRELYKQELLDEGYSVILAANGKEALQRIEEENPDLVVLDIRMPEMNGIETLGKMVGKFKKIPIILNTAYSSYREDFRSWAAEAYVVKSSDMSELKEKIKEVLTKSRE